MWHCPRSHWSGCNFIPEDLNPKSFRSAFGHNTNVFAVRELRGMPVGPPVGVFTPEQVQSSTPEQVQHTLALKVGLSSPRGLERQVLSKQGRCAGALFHSL